ncbi:hypothetical protein HJG60_011490 [Phyllostomus discolor]|uniref:Uncharacterized protein n=1 Tax=Phyllostomus discolor TaxID=89673 RepID=A0A833ZVW5_9CHIR|nr:hypothetical protein HJG60_011490 [Phyllostomus discolor]
MMYFFPTFENKGDPWNLPQDSTDLPHRHSLHIDAPNEGSDLTWKVGPSGVVILLVTTLLSLYPRLWLLPGHNLAQWCLHYSLGKQPLKASGVMSIIANGYSTGISHPGWTLGIALEQGTGQSCFAFEDSWKFRVVAKPVLR